MRLARIRYSALVLLVSLGLALSAYLVWQHAHFLFSGQTGGLCTLVRNFDCSQIENSDYSEFFGVPTASFGLFYFAVFLVYLVAFRPTDPDDRRFRHGAALLNAAGVAVSITLGSISMFIIKSLCLGCVLTYSINLLLLLALIPWRRPWTYPLHLWRGLVGLAPYLRETLRTPSSGKPASASLLVLLIFAVVNFYAVPKYIVVERLRVIITTYDHMPVDEIPVNPWNIARGSADAPLQIIKFTDFQCPTCKRVNRDLEDILSELDQTQYRLVYKQFPLDRRCNKLVAQQGPDFDLHPGSCQIALIAQAAGSMGGFWKIATMLYSLEDFSNNGVMDQGATQKWLDAMAAKAGLNLKDWATFSISPVNQQRLMSDIEDGIKLKLVATPAIFINGRRAPGTKLRDLQTLIDHVLEP